jgi:hypothetical protein
MKRSKIVQRDADILVSKDADPNTAVRVDRGEHIPDAMFIRRLDAPMEPAGDIWLCRP